MSNGRTGRLAGKRPSALTGFLLVSFGCGSIVYGRFCLSSCGIGAASSGMPLAPGNSPYRLSKLQFSCTITTTWLSLFNPLALAAIAAGALVGAIALAAAGMAGVVGAVACELPLQAARMGSTSASSSSGEKIFH